MLGPIFQREVLTVPRRDNHYPGRLAALVLLWVLGVTAWQATVGFQRPATLGETARFGQLIFRIDCFLILSLLVFFSALSAASTISREKDRRTFVLLLMTDMRDYEIVLGKMLGSLLPIFAFLLGTVPLLFLLLLLGGVAAGQVAQAALILLATAVAAGSLGGLVALWREKTFQALALSVLCLVLYEAVLQALPAVAPLVGMEGVDWARVQGWLEPFAALQAVLSPPEPSPLIPAAYGYAAVMLLVSVLLNVLALRGLRRWNPSGEPIMQREAPGAADAAEQVAREKEELERRSAHAAPGEARPVWRNPILWREVATLAYGRKPLLIKLAFGVVLALILVFAISTLERPAGRPAFAAAYGLVPLAVLALLLVAAQAATSITSERDGRSLDLLLVTDLTPGEFIFGKIWGVVYNCKEFILPVILLAGYYAGRGALATTPAGMSSSQAFAYNFGPFLCVAGAALVLLTFALVLGIHVALRNENSRLAVANTLGTIFFLSLGTLISIYLILINGGSLGNQLLSFSAFLALGVGGLWWVLSADRPSPALTLAAAVCPLAMFYSVTNLIIADPISGKSADPLVPFLVVGAAFGFTVTSMLVPLLAEFDVALGRSRDNQD